MNHQWPTADDGSLWDLHLSGVVLPSITAADTAGVFDELAKAPGSTTELAARLQLNERAVRALLPVLASSGLLAQRAGRYHLTEVANNYLLSTSPFYWGPILSLVRRAPISHEAVTAALKAPESAVRWNATSADNPTNAWSEGQITPELAANIAAYMHANSLSAARVAATRANLNTARRLLDVGGGSGCFSIAFARECPQLRCTIMDLQGMCDVALRYVRDGGVADRVDTEAVDMFRQSWPTGYDTVFLSNIFHDWDIETCVWLASKAFAALPPGGRILVHEMLLDDTGDGPSTTVAFSLYMLLATKGQQFTAAQLSAILSRAGFENITVTPSHHHYAIVSARKP